MLKSNNVAYCFSELECMYFCVEKSRNMLCHNRLLRHNTLPRHAHEY